MNKNGLTRTHPSQKSPTHHALHEPQRLEIVPYVKMVPAIVGEEPGDPQLFTGRKDKWKRRFVAAEIGRCQITRDLRRQKRRRAALSATWTDEAAVLVRKRPAAGNRVGGAADALP